MKSLILLLSLLITIKQQSPKYKAIVREDNDFATYTDTLSITEPVPVVIQHQIEKLYQRHERENHIFYKDQLTIFRIRYSDDINLYSVRFKGLSFVFYKIMAYNKRSGKFTMAPFQINGKWMENNEGGFATGARLINSPLMSFKTIDKRKMIVIKERVHNGTAYNGVVEHMVYLDGLMNFKQALNIETICLTADDCRVKRSYNNYKINSTITCKGKVLPLGEITLNTDYSIKHKTVQYKPYGNILLTASGVAEYVFLKKGYQFTY